MVESAKLFSCFENEVEILFSCLNDKYRIERNCSSLCYLSHFYAEMSQSDVKDFDEKKVEPFSARDRFSGALSSAVDRAESFRTDLDGHYFLGSPVKRQLNLDSPWSSPTKSPRSVRRRRKKEIPQEFDFNHTFVFKLYDRSLDLAQFSPTTGLYPVCRAWVKNQPNNTNLAPRMRSPTPEPPLDESEQELCVSNGIGGKEILNGDDEPPLKRQAVYKLPPCIPLKLDENGLEIRTRIPKPLEVKVSSNLDLSNSTTDPPMVSTLMKEHKSRWKKVRKLWKDANALNEARYEASFKVLKSLQAGDSSI